MQPLQAFSPRYFQAPSEFFTYAQEWQNALHTAEKQALADATAQMQTRLGLSQLSRLLRQPVSVFFQDNLNVRLKPPQSEVAAHEPFALNALEMYQFTHAIALGEDSAKAVAQLQLSGQLALAGLGQAQVDLLTRNSQALHERMAPWLAKYSQPLNTQSFEMTVAGETTQLAFSAQWPQTQQVWRVHNDGQGWLQLDVRAGSVVQGKDEAPQPRGSTLCDVWLLHLVACASGTPTTSVQIGLKGEIVFEPMSAQTAQRLLEQLIKLYQQAWQRILPVARDTACAWLVGQIFNNKNPELDAQQCFEGTHQRKGELAKSPELQRVFKSYADLQQDLPHWAQALYGDMIRAAHVVSHAQELA
jgi:exodeoxyribonuclease V gamma subunit